MLKLTETTPKCTFKTKCLGVLTRPISYTTGDILALISPPNLIKSPLKKKSNPNEKHKDPKESAIEGKADNANRKNNFKIKDYKDHKDNKKLVVKMTTRFIQRNKAGFKRGGFAGGSRKE